MIEILDGLAKKQENAIKEIKQSFKEDIRLLEKKINRKQDNLELKIKQIEKMLTNNNKAITQNLLSSILDESLTEHFQDRDSLSYKRIKKIIRVLVDRKFSEHSKNLED